MATVVGIDPGVSKCGVTVLESSTGMIIGARLVKLDDASHDNSDASRLHAMALAVRDELRTMLDALGRRGVEVLAVERQYIGRQTGNPEQLVLVAMVAGLLLGAIPAARRVLVWPAQWNRGAKKEDTGRALVANLHPLELQAIGTTPRDHNLIDSFGIAKYAARNLSAFY